MRNIFISAALSFFFISGCYPVCEDGNCDQGTDVNVDVTCSSNCNSCCNQECPTCQECQDCPECQECPACPECPDCCGCEGQVSWFILQYTGQNTSFLKVVQQDGQVVFYDWVDPGEKFVLFGLANNGVFGTYIDIYKDCQYKCENPCVLNTTLNTSCAQPIGLGQQSGEFLVVDGESYLFDGPLCSVSAP